MISCICFCKAVSHVRQSRAECSLWSPTCSTDQNRMPDLWSPTCSTDQSRTLDLWSLTFVALIRTKPDLWSLSCGIALHRYPFCPELHALPLSPKQQAPYL